MEINLKRKKLYEAEIKAKEVANNIWEFYPNLPKAYRIMYVQELPEVKELTAIEIIFLNKYLNKK